MQERELFLSALEFEEPATRRAHLESACAGDAEMLARVEALLDSHEAKSQCLNTPAVEQMADDAAGGVDATILVGEDATKDDESGDASDDGIPLGYLEPSSKADSLGRLGHYEILEVIGRGAFGTVLRAFDEKLQRVVAIKVLAPEIAATSPARKRFLREARASAAVRHENVVAVYAVEDRPIPYLVMEYIPGKTLQRRLDEQGPLELTHVLRLGKQIADGLAAAHAQDLIHRDVKPGNILLEGGIDNRVKITDFGLARTADDASMTQSGVIAGTPLYMAPEQALGQKLDKRADLFSLGSVLYQMISGRPPFRAPTTLAVLKRVVDDTPRPIPEIIPETPDWLCELIGHLHAKDPDGRYGTAKNVSKLLANCLSDVEAGRTPKIPPPGHVVDKAPQAATSQVSQREPQPLWKNPIAIAAAVMLTLLAIVTITETTGVTSLIASFSEIPPEAPNPDGTANTRVEPIDPHSSAADILTSNEVTQPLHWPADAPPLAIAPYNAEQAKQHQQTWADRLGLPVEKEVVLGRNQRGLDIKLSMVLIPPGEYLMGSSDEEIAKLREQARGDELKQQDFQWIDLEGPQRRVRITRPFYMSRTELTKAQFGSFVDATEYRTQAESSGKGSWTLRGHNMVLDPQINWRTQPRTAPGAPVMHVTWNDAMACCRWLSGKDAELTFSLPTEAQWEYACRAGTATAWCFGDDESVLKEYAIVNSGWYLAGTKKPNAFGLYDMHGNVWEWCRDSIGNYRDAASVDPVGPDDERRIIRGGNCFGGDKKSWNNANGCRSAARYEAAANLSVVDKGFRVIAEIPEKLLQSKALPGRRTYASDEWIDVIPLLDPELDKSDRIPVGKNEWRIEDGELLVGQADVKSHKLVFPLDGVWTAFDFEMEVTRRAGESGFCVNFPTSNGECPIALDWPEGIRVGMGENLRDRYFRFGPAMKIGERTVLRFQVRRQNGTDVVSTWRGDKPIGVWEGDCSKYATGRQPVHPDTRRLSLYLPDGQREFVFHRIRVRVLDGGTATTLRPIPVQQPAPIDLLPLIDDSREKIRKENGVLVLRDEPFSNLVAPVAYEPVPAEYDLHLEVERREGQFTFGIGIPYGGHEGMIVIDGWGSKFSGLEVIDGKPGNKNPTSVQGAFLAQGKRVPIVVAVRRGSIRLQIGEREIFSWTGRPEQLRLSEAWPDGTDSLFLGAQASEVAVHKFTLTPYLPSPPGGSAGVPSSAPPSATAPFNADEAKQRQ